VLDHVRFAPLITNSKMPDASFSTAAFFWLLAGILIGIAVAFAFGKLWRQSQTAFGRPRGITVFAGCGVTLAVTAVLLYNALGRPEIAAGGAAPAPHSMSAASNADSNNSKSMEAMTEKLATRLSRDGGADSDWQLLAQSYDFVGRTEDAERARQHIVAPAANGTTADNARVSTEVTELPDLIQQTKSRPYDAAAWLALAEAHRRQRSYTESLAAFDTVIKLNAMTADSWADYADALASAKQSGANFSGAPAKAIEKALTLNPNHTKALWLKASFAHEEHRYADALTVWKQLRAVIDDNDSDARIIDANIAEAEQLAGGQTPSKLAQTNTQKNFQSGRVAGTIDIDRKLLTRIEPGAILFIYAKAVDSPGPPLAVLRTTITHWPVDFKLDDSMAMMPSRTLSSVASAIIEARISRSGQAIATAGDLQAPGIRVELRDGKAVHLRIGKVVG
jgi:cytochrome c-type biogenesis protein CcmH/NrfG